MYLILATVSVLVPAADIAAEESRFFVPEVLENCYARNNILEVNIDTDQICVVFDSDPSPECEQLPQGIYLDIQVSNFPDSVIRARL
ncbi:hypothetical protein SS50377_26256 [Spironucleus salmonicida]|uniref:Uncharacterized protein n=1 Tax=Spironucleus salmonicida TaxID=348837 RepID=A0A9P8LQ02_9EUKA|nr:hypothetical protein SS50377_26256 [Spironucleus salmonicida]